jgi:hypothetical protein
MAATTEGNILLGFNDVAVGIDDIDGSRDSK